MVDNKWSTNTSNGESGILRKAAHQQNTSKKNILEIFGYSCKIFRDDEKARYIDQGKHLIPWMGGRDQSLKIDRYDVRATLHDLVQYEVPLGGYTNRLDYLSPAEQKAEQLCEEERYFSLYHNEEDEKMYQEEELKRLQQMTSSSYGQVGFSYDTNSSKDGNDEADENEEPEEQDEAFVPPANFDIPEDIVLPDTMKEHAIIEKTARFISTQGAQMEILIKTKQANNTQFDFLMQNNRLYDYYKHVHNAIKNGTYPKEEILENEITKENTDETTAQYNNNFMEENPYYSALSLRTTIPTIVYQPSADCSYTQLISKITGVPLPLVQSSDVQTTLQSDTNAATTTSIGTPITTTQYTNSEINQTNYDFNSYYTTQPPVIYPSQTQPPPPPPPSSSLSELITNPLIKPIENFIQNSDGVEVKKISTGLMLAQYYNTDSESDNESMDDDSNTNDDKLNFPFPPESLQNIIDKTATYVIKNGKNFEDILRTKQDLRFSFLDDTNEFHRYYLYKVTGKVPNIKIVNGTKPSDDSLKPKVITPVSFSIKTKEEQTIPIKGVLPQEQSSDEEDKLDEKNKIKINDVKSSALDTNIIEQNQQLPQQPIVTNTLEKDQKIIPETLDLISEIISGQFSVKTNDSVIAQGKSQIKETKKISDEKLKDKLAAAAREKMGCISKEKQLQLERKKKAMAFLNQMKIPNVQSQKTNDSITDLTKDNSFGGNDSDIESCHSIPTSPIIQPRKIETNTTDLTLQIKNRSRSRSRSKSSSSRHKKKKSKSHHSKKKTTKRKSRSRSRSWSRERKYRKQQSSSSSHRNDSIRHNRYRDD